MHGHSTTDLFGHSDEPTKVCTRCRRPKPFSAFNRRAEGRFQLGSMCKACWREYRKTHSYQASRAANNHRCRFGIEPEDYAAILDRQKGVCAICGLPERKLDFRTQKVHSLSVDHDHETNSVRGLLCNICNRALGLFQDDPKILRAALAYLASHRKS